MDVAGTEKSLAPAGNRTQDWPACGLVRYEKGEKLIRSCHREWRKVTAWKGWRLINIWASQQAGSCLVSCWVTVRCQEAVCYKWVTKVFVSCRSLSGKDEWVWQVFDRLAELCRSHVIRLRFQQEEGEGNITAMWPWNFVTNLYDILIVLLYCSARARITWLK